MRTMTVYCDNHSNGCEAEAEVDPSGYGETPEGWEFDADWDDNAERAVASNQCPDFPLCAGLGCAAETYPGDYFDQPSYCDDETVAGSEYCAAHASLVEGPDPDDERDAMLDERWDV